MPALPLHNQGPPLAAVQVRELQFHQFRNCDLLRDVFMLNCHTCLEHHQSIHACLLSPVFMKRILSPLATRPEITLHIWRIACQMLPYMYVQKIMDIWSLHTHMCKELSDGLVFIPEINNDTTVGIIIGVEDQASEGFICTMHRRRCDFADLVVARVSIMYFGVYFCVYRHGFATARDLECLVEKEVVF
jgi:hypothetical protein